MGLNLDPTRIDSPCTREATQALRAGDRVLLSGILVTARDMAHRRMVQAPSDEVRDVLKNAFVYHCGPVVLPDGGGWRVMSAGPTTSMREEPFQAAVIREFGLRGVVGKGGMGDATASALRECGGVYLHATGGAGASLASRIVEVIGVHFLQEFGVPEAMWILRVRDFPAIVTMDSTGRSVHRDVLEESSGAMDVLLRR